MGTFSIWHWLIVLVVVLVLFGGGGKLSRIMGDLGSGMKNFKKNIKDEAAQNNNAQETITKTEQIDGQADGKMTSSSQDETITKS